MTSRKLGVCTEKVLSAEEQQAKINDVRKILGPIAGKLPEMFSDASISRYLRARNWSPKKAAKMLKESLKWRLEFKPEKIRWEDVAKEAETGKIYRANFLDRKGRSVIILRPGFQNTNEVLGQIRHFVYCMEDAIMTSNPDQEQMVWLIDFQNWSMSSISMKAAKETANVLQNHYPERLGIAILYNPPKIFESFWTMVKPFIEPRTYKKVRFVYLSDTHSQKIMEELFDMDKLDSAFGGRNPGGFDFEAYGQRMKEEDKKLADLIGYGYSTPISSAMLGSQHSSPTADAASEASDVDECSSSDETASNLKAVEETIQGPPVTCKEAANGEGAEVMQGMKSEK